jgi:hypothetical protein
MPNEFTFVGEHRDDTDQLLVLGDDGNYYRYQPAQESFAQVQPDETWLVFDDGDEPISDPGDRRSTTS